MVSAIIVAAGRGTRMGPNVDKLFLEIAGRPVAALIETVGSYRIRYLPPDFETLVKSIVYQQLSGKVAKVILDRLHPADIAYILEALPLDDRLVVWDGVKADRDGEILMEGRQVRTVNEAEVLELAQREAELGRAGLGLLDRHADCGIGTYFFITPEGDTVPIPRMFDLMRLFGGLNDLAAEIDRRTGAVDGDALATRIEVHEDRAPQQQSARNVLLGR